MTQNDFIENIFDIAIYNIYIQYTHTETTDFDVSQDIDKTYKSNITAWRLLHEEYEL